MEDLFSSRFLYAITPTSQLWHVFVQQKDVAPVKHLFSFLYFSVRSMVSSTIDVSRSDVTVFWVFSALSTFFLFFQVAFCKVKLSLRVPFSIRSYSTNWQLHSRAKRRSRQIQRIDIFTWDLAHIFTRPKIVYYRSV